MKIDRKKVYEKYGGRCAYCGREIAFKDMQVDHFIPQRDYADRRVSGDKNNMENLMPSCRVCNHYKRDNSLDYFRELIEEIPCKLAKRQYIYKVGMAYGFYDGERRKVEFYFERCDQSKGE